MTTQCSKKIRRIYSIVLCIALITAGICLMAACLNIYDSGSGSFSREIVAQQFSTISIPVYLCLVMVILGFVLDIFLPGEKPKTLPEKNYALILDRLHAKTDLSLCEEDQRGEILREQKSRKCHKVVTIILLILGSVLYLSYGLNGNNFHQREITDSLIAAMAWLVPCVAVPFSYAVFCAYHSKASMLREIELLKKIGANRTPAPEQKRSTGRGPEILRWAVLAAALAILVYGYAAGGTADVLTKAINICTECVGLG